MLDADTAEDITFVLMPPMGGHFTRQRASRGATTSLAFSKLPSRWRTLR